MNNFSAMWPLFLILLCGCTIHDPYDPLVVDDYISFIQQEGVKDKKIKRLSIVAYQRGAWEWLFERNKRQTALEPKNERSPDFQTAITLIADESVSDIIGFGQVVDTALSDLFYEVLRYSGDIYFEVADDGMTYKEIVKESENEEMQLRKQFLSILSRKRIVFSSEVNSWMNTESDGTIRSSLAHSRQIIDYGWAPFMLAHERGHLILGHHLRQVRQQRPIRTDENALLYTEGRYRPINFINYFLSRNDDDDDEEELELEEIFGNIVSAFTIGVAATIFSGIGADVLEKRHREIVKRGLSDGIYHEFSILDEMAADLLAVDILYSSDIFEKSTNAFLCNGPDLGKESFLNARRELIVRYIVFVYGFDRDASIFVC